MEKRKVNISYTKSGSGSRSTRFNDFKTYFIDKNKKDFDM